MNIAAQVLLVFGAIGMLLLLMALVRRLAQRANLGAEVQRKVVHIGTGFFAMALPWLFPERWPVYVLIAVTLVVMVVLRLPSLSGKLGDVIHGVERRSHGDFLLAIAIGLCFFLAEGDVLFYILPIAVLTLSDAAAALTGTTYGSRRFKVESGHKSVEGSVAFFVVTLLIALILLMFLSDLPPANILTLAVMMAAFGTLVEAQSWRGFDNFFLPLGLQVFLIVHSQTSLLDLLGIAALFLFVIVSFRTLGKRLGYTTHAIRVYVVAMFLILAVVELQNAIFPALVLLTHVWATLRHPSRDEYGDLDIVAALALFSFGWLALGRATGWNAVQFYGLTSMGIAMGLMAIALKRQVFWVPVIAGLLYGLRLLITELNSLESRWAEPLWFLPALCLALPASAVWLAPAFFNKDRGLKLTLLSLALPLSYYIFLLLNRSGLTAMMAGGGL